MKPWLAIAAAVASFFGWLRSLNTRERIVDSAMKSEDERVANADAAGDAAGAEFDERERLRNSGKADAG